VHAQKKQRLTFVVSIRPSVRRGAGGTIPVDAQLAAIAQIEHDVKEVNECFRDLSALVQEQGESLNAIENNVCAAAPASFVSYLFIFCLFLICTFLEVTHMHMHIS
jgi:hypothetical protein